ncbi:hypothetical protein JHL18_13590 [Clostridium sp. YIM B02505]|uniref:Uncharacterized protein n=1 Tax=Clostridium yunnanense TaxID=2800325 RepID=A0ABS1EQG7_9CLOT|nr:hypothetical protein [Clostridium yunnanense]MBK1811651.1 hypothetical protein [Clostridium yunnanense]
MLKQILKKTKELLIGQHRESTNVDNSLLKYMSREDYAYFMGKAKDRKQKNKYIYY